MAVATADRLAPEDGAFGIGGAAFGRGGLATEGFGTSGPGIALGGEAWVLAEITRVCKAPNLVDVASMCQRLSVADSKKPRCNTSTKMVNAPIFVRLGKLMPSALKSMSIW